MLRKRYSLLVVIILLVAFSLLLVFKKNIPFAPGNGMRATPSQAAGPKKLQRVGEKIVYEVRLHSLHLGRAIFEHLPQAELNNRQVNLMTFTTRLTRFNDVEKIYCDPETYLPIRIERNISTFPTPEKITEEYDAARFSVDITKIKGRREEKISFQQDSPIQNAILLPFSVRDIPGLEVGWHMEVTLPAQKYEIKLVSIEDVSVPAGTFKAYRFESDPKKFEIWVSVDARRIPLKIKGMGGLGYNLAMKEHSLH